MRAPEPSWSAIECTQHGKNGREHRSSRYDVGVGSRDH